MNGPYEVEYAGVDGHRSPTAWKSNVIWRWAHAGFYFSTNVVFAHPLLFLCIVIVGPLTLLLYILGLPLYIWQQWPITARADLSGVRFAGTDIHWNEVVEVVSDNIEWRSESQPYVRHAVVLVLEHRRLALLLRTFPRADAVATQLEFLRRNSRGTPEDVPDALGHTQQAALE